MTSIKQISKHALCLAGVLTAYTAPSLADGLSATVTYSAELSPTPPASTTTPSPSTTPAPPPSAPCGSPGSPAVTSSSPHPLMPSPPQAGPTTSFPILPPVAAASVG